MILRNKFLFLGVNTELLDTLLCPESDTSSRAESSNSSSSGRNEDTDVKEQSPSSKQAMRSFNALLISKLMAIANLSCKPGELGLLDNYS